jgi:membrane protease YdiL (CAAX protease family)
MQRVGALHEDDRDEHVAGEEESIEPREESDDEQRPAEKLGVGGDVSEEGGDAVARHVGGERGGAPLAEDFRVAVGKKDQAGGNAQREPSKIAVPIRHGAQVLASLSLFVSLYLATFLGGGFAAARFGFHEVQWIALLAVLVATAVTVALMERGRWTLGVAASPSVVIRELLGGALFAALLIAACDALIVATTALRHLRGNGFPWGELAAVFVPAAVHEELAFRGYLFQKLLQFRRVSAYIFSGLLFAALHAGNQNVSLLALTNIALAGVMLGLAYELHRRLWFPIGLHLAWNLASGPILGYEVSGYVSHLTLFRTVGSGPQLLTGGGFGLEGSIWATAVEAAAIAFLFRYHSRATARQQPT